MLTKLQFLDLSDNQIEHFDPGLKLTVIKLLLLKTAGNGMYEIHNYI